MIPLSIWRAALVLLLVSAAIGAVEAAVEAGGGGPDTSRLVSGCFAGATVFMLIHQAGRLLRMCGKGIVDDKGRRAKIRQALLDLDILEERRSGRSRVIGAKKLAAAERRKGSSAKLLMYVSVVDSDRFIAITVNEGSTHRAFISTKMVDVMSTAALRGVLAHEFGHVCNHHPFKQALLLGTVAAFKLSVGVPVGAVIVILMAYLYMLRQWEYLADQSACERAGDDSLLRAFKEYQEITDEKNMSLLSELFSGHPSIHRRVEAILQS